MVAVAAIPDSPGHPLSPAELTRLIDDTCPAATRGRVGTRFRWVAVEAGKERQHPGYNQIACLLTASDGKPTTGTVPAA